jgi:hypothetical protein
MAGPHDRLREKIIRPKGYHAPLGRPPRDHLPDLVLESAREKLPHAGMLQYRSKRTEKTRRIKNGGENLMREHYRNAAIMIGAAVTLFVWLLMLIHFVSIEERATASRGFVVDNAGEIVEIHSRVWELGKGYRPATQEEEEFEADRVEGAQR